MYEILSFHRPIPEQFVRKSKIVEIQTIDFQGWIPNPAICAGMYASGSKTFA